MRERDPKERNLQLCRATVLKLGRRSVLQNSFLTTALLDEKKETLKPSTVMCAKLANIPRYSWMKMAV